MTVRLVRKFKMVAVWNDERLEVWLTGMAAQGLVLQDANGVGIYTFRQGPSSREPLIYCWWMRIVLKNVFSKTQMFRHTGVWRSICGAAGRVFSGLRSPP